MTLCAQGLELNWTGKTATQRVARQTPFHALEPVSAHGAPGSGNLLVQGDNLLALKSLLPFFKGRVKCIRHEFRFHPDRYPARPPYYQGSVRFKKRYYPLINDLRDGGEEWQCAMAIESLPEVEKWVRNIPQDRVNSFWLPTSTDYYYPDFVCELKDGRLLVVEYKGGDRMDSGDATEKARIGERWAATSKNRRCIFVQVSKADPLKRSIDKQLKDAISGVTGF